MHGFITYVNVVDAVTLSEADLSRTFTEARQSGFEAARLVVPWNTVHTAASSYTWTAADRAVNAALAANLPVLLVLAPPAPSWVTLTTRQAQFAAFAAAAAVRYRPNGAGITVTGRSVSEYQIWDEPNAFSSRWPTSARTPQAAAAEYANLLKAAQLQIKANHPQARVIFAGLRAGPTASRSMAQSDAVSFLTDAYTVARPYFDAVAYHPLSLPTSQYPTPPAPSGASIAQSDALRQVMVARGDSGKKLLWTQLGWDTTKVTATQQRLYLDSMRWFAQTRKDHLAGIALDYRDSAGRPAGLVAANWSPRPARAQIARWHDGATRHTLYTACGTQQDAWGLTSTTMNPAEAAAALALYRQLGGTGTPTPGEFAGNYRSPDTIMGTRVNPDLFNWVPVSYPASFPAGAAALDTKWQPQNISFGDSVRTGVAELTRLIQATPGTFALSGMSQGAVVMSQILRAMQPGGALAHRAGDCIGAVMFGNPCRRVGASFPGGTPASGAGMFSGVGAVPGLASVAVPSWWWEMCTPGDFFSDAPMTGPAGPLLADVAQALGGFRGSNSGDVVRWLSNFLSALSTRGVGLRALSTVLAGQIATFFKAKPGPVYAALEAWVAVQSSYPVNPHILYGNWSPPTLPSGLGLSAGATYVDVGAAYLNARGAAVNPR